MGGSRSILVGVVLSVLVVGLVFWTLWSGDRPPRNEPSNGVVSEPDLELEPEVEHGSEAADEQRGLVGRRPTLLDANEARPSHRHALYVRIQRRSALCGSTAVLRGDAEKA